MNPPLVFFLGGNDLEMATIRAEEDAAQAALANAEDCLDGWLRIVPLPHGRTATVMDRIAAFPDGFSGGDLPHAGFWGHGAPTPPRPELLRVLGGVLPRGNGG